MMAQLPSPLLRHILRMNHSVHNLQIRRDLFTSNEKSNIAADALARFTPNYITKKLHTIHRDTLLAYITRHCATLSDYRQLMPLMYAISKDATYEKHIHILMGHAGLPCSAACVAGMLYSMQACEMGAIAITDTVDADLILAAAFSSNENWDEIYDYNQITRIGANAVHAFLLACALGWYVGVSNFIITEKFTTAILNQGLYSAITGADDETTIGLLIRHGGELDAVLVDCLYHFHLGYRTDRECDSIIGRCKRVQGSLENALCRCVNAFAFQPHSAFFAANLLCVAGARNQHYLFCKLCASHNVFSALLMSQLPTIRMDPYVVHEGLCEATRAANRSLILLLKSTFTNLCMTIPLRIAVMGGNVSIVNVLLDGQSIDMLDYTLNLAAIYGRQCVCAEMLRKGASDLHNALYAANIYGHAHITRMLQRKQSNRKKNAITSLHDEAVRCA